jgi:glycerophosphoryl diester phosphodiesterase
VAAHGWLIARPVAHRGYHDRAVGRVENTLSAAAAAVARGFAVECDVRLSADSEVIVFHDETLDRLTTGTGAVGTKSLAKLKATRLRGTDDRIPTLGELLATVGGAVPLFVELKSDGDGHHQLAPRVAEILAGYAGWVAVMSFDPETVRAMRSLAPARLGGMVADRFDGEDSRSLSWSRRFALRHLLHAPTVRPDFIAYGVAALPAGAPLLLRHLGLPLLTWTVRTPADCEVARRHADQIIFEGFDPDARQLRTTAHVV